MTKRCIGCGATLQDHDPSEIGYVKDLTQDYCERCFRIQHYGDYRVVERERIRYDQILQKVNASNDLVVFVVDLFNINRVVYELASKIKNPVLLVLTKRDLFASDIYDEKFLKYFDDFPSQVVDKVLISSKNNFGYDLLYQKIREHQKSKNVYVVGLTNAGKSTMMNRLLYHYEKTSETITTSNLPSTTLDMIAVPFSDTLTFIDTPGIVDYSITNFIDVKQLKKIIPNNVIRPITYQVKQNQSFVIDSIFRIDVPSGENITMFFSNQLQVMRYYKKLKEDPTLEKHILNVPDRSDIVIAGLGFIKVVKSGCFTVYTLPKVEVSVRKALI